jgi:hypothetical protein
MLENFVFPQTVAEVDGLIFEQDGAPAYFGAIVSTTLDERLLVDGLAGEDRLIGHHRVLT